MLIVTTDTITDKVNEQAAREDPLPVTHIREPAKNVPRGETDQRRV
jgi:hypothetical protein